MRLGGPFTRAATKPTSPITDSSEFLQSLSLWMEENGILWMEENGIEAIEPM
jgi:hypothetical protein